MGLVDPNQEGGTPEIFSLYFYYLQCDCFVACIPVFWRSLQGVWQEGSATGKLGISSFCKDTPNALCFSNNKLWFIEHLYQALEYIFLPPAYLILSKKLIGNY